MESMTVILFLCATVPMVPALYLIPDKPSRLFLGYMLLGMSVCLIASEINSQLLGLFGGNAVYVSKNITPHRRGIDEGAAYSLLRHCLF